MSGHSVSRGMPRRAATLSRLCEGATTPALAALESQVLLSARELEVASLAVSGLSNREIAQRLCLGDGMRWLRLAELVQATLGEGAG